MPSTYSELFTLFKDLHTFAISAIKEQREREVKKWELMLNVITTPDVHPKVFLGEKL